ncbi:serine hydrolase domain-containing protein [Alkalibacter saccharofermentans]|uniref:CubicO group peptidase, beta-lactamase class C family n=1 Tax=Alkalibacter saccharofermentans DSM 14828 TaxID=1120975 RepID=A0A1M4WDI0_9FIRM|nr:serine hydrolase domain-containing protein [Alkalibacter saccharofermentans]SHE79299.1 CubicO group peptidase, beta-lactamase class C family [Alkalibacter saccharofermentans DSM 14828]
MLRKYCVLFLSIVLIFSWSESTLANDGGKTPSGIPIIELEEFIDDYMSEYIGKTSPGAAVVLVKDGEIIFSKGYGYANIESGILVDPRDTVFEYGSVSKLFVYTTMMRLSEEGKIDLQADIRDYLPADFLKKIKYDEPITMINIMNHTTGFEDFLFDVVLLNSNKNRPTMEQTLRKSQPMQVYRPGKISAYSNYAVGLAAYIAEQIIGQDFYQYLMETIFLTLDMDQTSAHPTLEDRDILLESKANGYYRKGNGVFVPGHWSYIPIYPVGSVNGTAEDLARFAIALMPAGGQKSPLFNKRATLDSMLSQSHAMGPQLTGFAYGFIEWDGEKRGVGHGGNTAAFSSQINIVPEERFGVVILTNVNSEMDITSGLTEELIGKRIKSLPVGGDDLPDVKEVEGTYIAARRMHNGFLEIYGYLNLLKVEALEPNKIQLSMAGQTSTLVQTRPYVFERTESQGAIFDYHFRTIYFEAANGKVQRLSGDFLPLPGGRTMPWLLTFLAVAVISTSYFVIAPIALLVRRLWQKKRGFKYDETSKIVTFMMLCGTGLIINNALLAMRMLYNNYRSFSEMRIHILLNNSLVASTALLLILLVRRWQALGLSKAQKVLLLVTVGILVALIAVLINWQFLKMFI